MRVKPIKINSGSSPTIYKIGMFLYKINPKLWDAGLSVLGKYNSLISSTNLKNDPLIAGNVEGINLELTVLCNLRCTMCWWWGEKGIAFNLVKNKDPAVTQQLSKEEIFNIIDQLSATKPTFYLSGGEPFERKDTIDIIEYLDSKGIGVLTNSNGTMLDESTLQRLSKVKRLTINFSIDGPRDVHDKIRGAGNYDKTMNTIKRLVELRGKESFPSIKTNTTFSPWIVDRLDEMIQELQTWGTDGVRMQHLWWIDSERAALHRKALNELFGINDVGVNSHVISIPTAKYVEALAKSIKAVESKRYKVPVFIHPKMSSDQLAKYYQDLSYVRTKSCNVPWSTMHIKSNGDIMFCPDEWVTQYKIGNSRDAPVLELWNNEKAKYFRSQLDKVKLFPGCSRCCAINT